MLWLFQAGIVASKRQMLAVLVVTSIIGLLSTLGFASPLVAPGSTGHLEVSPALTWSYLLLAVHSVILPKNIVEITVARMRLVARRLSPTNPGKAALELRSMLWLAAISDGVLTIAPPPSIVLIVSGYFRCSAAGAIGWDALMSIGMAYFGASALAAQQLPHGRPP